jgi:hypothetical protein
METSDAYDEGDVTGQPVKAGNQQGSAALSALLKGGKQLRPVRVSASALDLGELGHELAAVDLAGDGLTLRVKAQPARALAVGRNTVIGNEISHGSASIVATLWHQLPFVQILNVGLDLYRCLLVYNLAFMNCLEMKVNFILFFNSFIVIGLMRLCPL